MSVSPTFFHKYEMWVRAKPHRGIGVAVVALAVIFTADTLIQNRPSWSLTIHIAILSLVMFGAIVAWFALVPYLLRRFFPRISLPGTRRMRLVIALGFLGITVGGAYLIEMITQAAFDRVGGLP